MGSSEWNRKTFYLDKWASNCPWLKNSLSSVVERCRPFHPFVSSSFFTHPMAAFRPFEMGQAKLNPSPQHPPLAPSSTAAPVLAPAGAPLTAPSTASGLPERLMYKNRLQEYTQRSGIPLPTYRTVSEGSQHAPQFRSTVMVDGVNYVSSNTFSKIKAAEQDAAKCALEDISRKIKDEGCPLIREDTVFCKSILNEFAVKMNLEKPTCKTVQLEGLLPVFISSLTFNGVTYTGEAAGNKKEAKQLAARAVILSLLGSSGLGTLLSEIINSKRKLYAALHKVKDPSFAHTSAVSQRASVRQINTRPHGASVGQTSAMPQETTVGKIIAMPQWTSLVQSSDRSGVSLVQISALPRGVSTGQIPNVLDKAKEAEVAACVKKVLEGSIPGASSVMTPYNHKLKAQKLEEPSSPFNQELKATKLEQPSSSTLTEPSSQATDLPIAFVPPVLQQHQDERPTTKKRRKNKKVQSDPQLLPRP